MLSSRRKSDRSHIIRELIFHSHHSSNNWDAVSTSYSSHHSPWKGVSQIVPVFPPFTKLSLGCGNLIRFWLDLWVDSIPLRSRFPRLYNLSSLKDCLISSFKFSDNSWNFHFHRNLRDSEVGYLANLLVLIQPFQTSPPCSDLRLWSTSSSGVFSVSSFFSAICLPSPPHPFPI